MYVFIYLYMWGVGVPSSLNAPSIANVSKPFIYGLTIVQLRVCSNTKVVMEMYYCYIMVIHT